MALIVFFPAYFSLADSLVFRPSSVTYSSCAPSVLGDFFTDGQRGLLSLATLPYQAWMMTDAIVRALWRMTVSRKHLLEWETAADAEKRAGTTRARSGARWGLRQWSRAATAVRVDRRRNRGSWSPLPLARALARRADHRVVVLDADALRVDEPVTGAAGRVLRRIARKTWRFFETFVVEHGHHLAPDNFQEDPGGVVAWRTSPTNIGLQLLSYVTGYDLGYTTVEGLTERTARTLSAMTGLERYRGHYYNWYDIATLEPMRPAYVSTVDSGNLAGHLLVLRVALLEASESPLLGRSSRTVPWTASNSRSKTWSRGKMASVRPMRFANCERRSTGWCAQSTSPTGLRAWASGPHSSAASRRSPTETAWLLGELMATATVGAAVSCPIRSNT